MTKFTHYGIFVICPAVISPQGDCYCYCEPYWRWLEPLFWFSEVLSDLYMNITGRPDSFIYVMGELDKVVLR